MCWQTEIMTYLLKACETLEITMMTWSWKWTLINASVVPADI